MQAVSVYALWSLLRSSDSICVRACMHSRCVFISATAPIQRSVRYRYELENHNRTAHGDATQNSQRLEAQDPPGLAAKCERVRR